MKNGLSVKEIKFLDDILIVARDEKNIIWAGASCICNALGLNKNQKDRQIKNIQSDEILKRGCVKFDVGVLDINNVTIALQLDYLPLWLAKISITPAMKRNNPNLVEKLIQYQLNAKDVLAKAFLPVCKPKEEITNYMVFREEKTINQVAFKEVVQTLPIIADFLKVNDISRLMMVERLYKDYNIPTNFLPNYAKGEDEESKLTNNIRLED